MIFDVAVAKHLAVFAFKLGKQIARHFAHDVHEQVQTATMGHAHDKLLNTVVAGVVHHFIHGGNKTFPPFKRETLLTHILCVQVALKAFRLGQLLENVALAFGVVGRHPQRRLKAFLNPALGSRIGNMHEFSTN